MDQQPRVFVERQGASGTADVQALAFMCAQRSVDGGVEWEHEALRLLHTLWPKPFPSWDVRLTSAAKSPSWDAAFVAKARRLGGRELDDLEAHIVHEAPLWPATYFGLQTLRKGYLLPGESPHQLIMRVAIALGGDTLDGVRDFAVKMARRQFTVATPTLFHAGTGKNLASCFLYNIQAPPARETAELWGCFSDLAAISSVAGGLGVSMSSLRGAEGDRLDVVQRVMKPLNEMVRTVVIESDEYDDGNTTTTAAKDAPKSSKRRSSCACYLEPWHVDVEAFLECRLTHGNSANRTYDLFTALYVDDSFMRCVESDGDWALFDPATAPGLDDLWGDALERRLCEYLPRAKKIVKARRIWDKLLVSLLNSGQPYVVFKDTCNRKSNQKNRGTIKSSNLCAEIVQFSSPDETAVCNLASCGLPSFLRPAGAGPGPAPGAASSSLNWTFDWKGLYDTVCTVAAAVDRAIDLSAYPTDAARASNLTMRPVGIGISGFHDCLTAQGFAVGSPEALQFDGRVHATIYHAALRTSVHLAQSKGAYAHFAGSPASQGQLQPDLRGLDDARLDADQPPGMHLDWESLRRDVASHGLRNSLSVALMPTASTSQILGYSESFEAPCGIISSRRTLAGDFTVVHGPSRDRLEALGFWTHDVRQLIVRDHGSVQKLKDDAIDDGTRRLLRTAFEIPQRDVLNHAIRRGPYVCQSQSLNVHMKDATQNKMSSLLFYAWRGGLKTGSYYTRTPDPAMPIPITLDAAAAARAGGDEDVCLHCAA